MFWGLILQLQPLAALSPFGCPAGAVDIFVGVGLCVHIYIYISGDPKRNHGAHPCRFYRWYGTA